MQFLDCSTFASGTSFEDIVTMLKIFKCGINVFHWTSHVWIFFCTCPHCCWCTAQRMTLTFADNCSATSLWMIFIHQTNSVDIWDASPCHPMLCQFLGFLVNWLMILRLSCLQFFLFEAWHRRTLPPTWSCQLTLWCNESYLGWCANRTPCHVLSFQVC